MPRFEEKRVTEKVKQFIITDEDREKIEKKTLLKMLELIYLIRNFENTILDLKEQQLVNGPVHTSVGQEAVASGCGIALKKKDLLGSTHRAHHHFLGKSLPFYYPDGYDPASHEFSSEMQECVERTMGEIMGLRIGWCGGRGGSMHLRNEEAGIIGTDAIVGGGIAMTTGASWAQKIRGTGTISVAFLGDGAVNQGILLESANMAKLWNIPVVFFVENNLYAVGTSTRESSSTEHIAQRALAFGMDGIIIDGMDPAAIYLLIREIRNILERKAMPFFVEAKTYRFYHHAGRSPGSTFGYRSREEESEWLKRDPTTTFPGKLIALGLLTGEEDDFIKNKTIRSIQKALSRVTVLDGGKRKIPDDLWPDRESLHIGAPGSGEELSGIKYSEKKDFSRFTKLTFVNVMSQVAARNMEKDSSVVVLGEEVANLGGGAYSATRFPLKKFPERVFNTPISEAGFTGIAFGASLCGIKPIVEIMFPDFALVSADQLFNQIAKLKYLYGGRVAVPLVVRTRIATGLGYGAQHSSDPGGLFAMFSGWRIVAPSNPFDYVGLFNTAMVSNDPVLIMEHHSLYREKGEVPRDNLDYFIPFGKATVFKRGDDLTVITYQRGVKIMERVAGALNEKGIDVECIDLRCLDYPSIDYDTIGESVKKTGRVIIIEEAPKSMGIGARVADELQLRFFRHLKSPIEHINSLDVPLPVSKRLEEEVLIDEEKVLNAIVGFME